MLDLSCAIFSAKIAGWLRNVEIVTPGGSEFPHALKNFVYIVSIYSSLGREGRRKRVQKCVQKGICVCHAACPGKGDDVMTADNVFQGD